MKISIILALLLTVVFCKAQEVNSYYVGEVGRQVYSLDSAIFIRTISTKKNTDTSTYAFVEYFLDKTIKRKGNTLSNNFRLKLFGEITSYDAVGKRTSTETFRDNRLYGRATYYYPNDSIKKKAFYFYNDKKQKAEKVLELNDSLGHHFLTSGTGTYKATNEYNELVEEEYLNGNRHGHWKIYNPKSRETYLAEYEEGIFLKGKIINVKGKATVYTQDELLPTFKGGKGAYSDYLHRTLEYPRLAKTNRTEGSVFVTFFIERDGSITNVKVVKGIGDGCDEEALRAINNSPRWSPRIQNGMPVRVAYTLPISFKLTGNTNPTYSSPGTLN